MLTAIETMATVAANRQLLLDEDLPGNVSSKVRVIVFLSENDLDDVDWLRSAAANEVFDFLYDEEENIYAITDGRPVADEI